jgi:hypothetical protein
MTDHTRRAPIAQPSAERTADQSTPSASGLTAERPGVDPERQYDDDQDVVARTEHGQADTPRKYEQHEDDEVLPPDDASLNTKI